MSRLYLETDHRTKVHGMGKEELVSKVQYFARTKLGLAITKKFLRKFGVPHLYDAMQAACHHNESFDVFRAWQARKQAIQGSLQF